MHPIYFLKILTLQPPYTLAETPNLFFEILTLQLSYTILQTQNPHFAFVSIPQAAPAIKKPSEEGFN